MHIYRFTGTPANLREHMLLISHLQITCAIEQRQLQIYLFSCKGWLGDAMVLGKLLVVLQLGLY